MRGCVSAGMIAAVSTLGLMDTFDAVYGSSAGSLVGAYAIAAQVGIVPIVVFCVEGTWDIGVDDDIHQSEARRRVKCPRCTSLTTTVYHMIHP